MMMRGVLSVTTLCSRASRGPRQARNDSIDSQKPAAGDIQVQKLDEQSNAPERRSWAFSNGQSLVAAG